MNAKQTKLGRKQTFRAVFRQKFILRRYLPYCRFSVCPEDATGSRELHLDGLPARFALGHAGLAEAVEKSFQQFGFVNVKAPFSRILDRGAGENS